MSSLLDFARENPIDFEYDKRFDYLREFKKADRKFKKSMGWAGPRIDKSNEMEVHQFHKRVLAEAYDNPSVNFEDALVGYMLVLGGYDYEKVKAY